ncbi:MAG: uroporphyrinogen-III C-methyltransferase [Deltaproteobacteria bacterium]|nr:uroporphyrinogen-III C-methyltransferase [Deltaproteobacteria bacterium]
MSAGAGGRVILVGAGPGAPDLITLRGARALRQADAVLYDELAPRALLGLAPPQAELVNVGRRGHDAPTRSQRDIEALLLRLARQGKCVVRLKGGDPYVFGRGGEEASACRAAGIPCEVVPGVSSAIGALAYAGIPVTDRRHAASFAVVTGHKDPTRVREQIRWEALARGADTLVVLMGARNLAEIAARLLAAGRSGQTPAALVMRGATARQRTLVAPLAEIARRAAAAGFAAPSALVVGEVVRLRPELAWFESLPLFGRRVLVTRQAGQAEAWQRALAAAGALPVPLPMVRIAPLRGTPEIARALSQLESYGLIALCSANAARHFAACLRQAGRSAAALPGRICAVGPATAQAATRAGLPVELLPPPAGAGPGAGEMGGGAESVGAAAGAVPGAAGLLAALLARGGLAGCRVLLPRAARGRQVLSRGLRAAGAQVDEIAVYRTEAAPFDGPALCGQLEAGALAALTFASPSAVRHFSAAVGPRGLRAARAAAVAAIGPVTAAACRAEGLPPNVVAARPSAGALVAALESHFGGLP